MCGGTQPPRPPGLRRTGLSPRVRGNHVLAAATSERNRSIPACAGEPKEHWHLCRSKAVYPRVCGGTEMTDGLFSLDRGLSPRVRGNPVSPPPCVLAARSIPACAGEPFADSILYLCGEVYPRVCGGTNYTTASRQGEPGLSPRVRGNRHHKPDLPGSTRSIPACAGEPTCSGPVPVSSRVYPRVCGGTPGTGAQRSS